VRREEQIELLKKECGAEHVLNSETETFDHDLYELSKKLNANVALECVAGPQTGRILQVLAHGGICINYGMLSEQKIGPINPTVLIFKAQRLESFLLPTWLNTKSLWGKIKALGAAKSLVEMVVVNKTYGLH